MLKKETIINLKRFSSGFYQSNLQTAGKIVAIACKSSHLQYFWLVYFIFLEILILEELRNNPFRK